MKITPDLCRAGRGLLNWSRADLANAAGVSTPVVVKFEHGGNLQQATIDKIAAAFDARGVKIENRPRVQSITRKTPPPSKQ